MRDESIRLSEDDSRFIEYLEKNFGINKKEYLSKVVSTELKSRIFDLKRSRSN